MEQGLQNLLMFRDNLQNPQRTAMQSLRDLDDLTKLSMSSGDYANMAFGGLVNNMMDPSDTMRYLESGGIVGLPVVQAGLGGFLKKITSIPRAIAKTVKRVAKSPLGRAAITLAPAFVGLPPVFANPALNAAFFSGTTSLLTGAKPKDALKSAILSGGLTGLTQGFTTPKPGTTSSLTAGGASDPNRFTYQPKAEVIGTPPVPQAETNIFKDLFRGATDRTYDPEGTGLSRLGQRLSGTGQFEGVGLGEQLGLQPGTAKAQADEALTGIESQRYQDFTKSDPTNIVNQTYQPKIAETVTKETPSLFSKLVPDTLGGKVAAGTAILGGLSALGGEEQIPQDQLDMAGLTVETDFDKQRFVYRDAEGNPLTTAQALQMIQTASQGFGEGGQRMASGVRGAFERVDPVLSASGGLIGMAYGGSMPMNNMDVKYKEFSGMVGGRGSGMEDNVYMPIVEGEQGQQVATLAVSPKEYVVDANTMSLLGNGNPDEGAEIMDKTVKDIRMAATGQTKQQKEIDGLAALNRMRRSV